jgi:hypothetical protein
MADQVASIGAVFFILAEPKKVMLVVIRNSRTGSFWRGDMWTKDLELARDFGCARTAIDYAKRKRLMDAEIILKLEKLKEEIVVFRVWNSGWRSEGGSGRAGGGTGPLAGGSTR